MSQESGDDSGINQKRDIMNLKLGIFQYQFVTELIFVVQPVVLKKNMVSTS